MPFGRPVEPEVNITQATSCGPTPERPRTGRRTGPDSGSAPTGIDGTATPSRDAGVATPDTTTATDASLATPRSQSTGWAGSSTTEPAPALSVARTATIKSMLRGRYSATRSPRPTPAPASRRASRAARSSSAR